MGQIEIPVQQAADKNPESVKDEELPFNRPCQPLVCEMHSDQRRDQEHTANAVYLSPNVCVPIAQQSINKCGKYGKRQQLPPAELRVRFHSHLYIFLLDIQGDFVN